MNIGVAVNEWLQTVDPNYERCCLLRAASTTPYLDSTSLPPHLAAKLALVKTEEIYDILEIINPTHVMIKAASKSCHEWLWG